MALDPRDRAAILERFQRSLVQHGEDSTLALRVGSAAHQQTRFRVLAEVMDCAPEIPFTPRLLDLGCGFGDFYAYLNANRREVSYTGYDINPDIIAVAKRRYPDAAFEVRDIQAQDFPDFDLIVASSTFNLRLTWTDNKDYVRDILTRCYQHAAYGVAVNMLSTYVDYQQEPAYHYQPEEIFRFAKSLTKRVALRHDYPLYEFTLYLYKDFTPWGRR